MTDETNEISEPTNGVRVDSSVAPSALLAVLHNIESFDKRRFASWVGFQPTALQKAARLCPPDRIYDLGGKLCYVFGFGKDGHVVVRGVGGAQNVNVHADPTELRDVTDDVKQCHGLS